MNYDIKDMTKCEYIQAMAKAYAKPPKQTETTCAGYRNKYSGALSKICADCPHCEVKNEV